VLSVSPACFWCGTSTSVEERAYLVRESRVLGLPSTSTRITRMAESSCILTGSAEPRRQVICTSPSTWLPVSLGMRVMS
jgi:hypothetical protein